MNRHILTGALASYLPRLVLFLTAPVVFVVITKRLPKEIYGAYSLILTTCALSSVVFTLGLQTFLGYAIPGADKARQYQIFVSVVSVEALLFLAMVIGILMPLSGWAAPRLDFPLSPVWLWAAPAAWVLFLFEHRVLLLLGLMKRVTLKVSLGMVERLSYAAGLAVLFFVGTTVLRVVTVQLVAYFIVLVLALSFLDRRMLLAARPNRDIIRAAFRYSLPLILVEVSWKVMETADRFMISYFHSTAEVGLYSYAFHYMNQAYLLGSPLLWSLYPFFAEAYKRGLPERNTLFRLQLTLTLTLSGFASMGLLVHREFLVPLLSRAEYLEAGWTFVIFAVSPVVISCVYLYQQVLLLERDTKFLGMNYVMTAVLNIALNLVLIPRYQVQGAALASLLAFSLLAVRIILRVRKKGGDLHLRWVCHFVVGWMLWAGLLQLGSIPGERAPWLFLILSVAAALPLAQVMGLIDFRELWTMFKTKEPS